MERKKCVLCHVTSLPKIDRNNSLKFIEWMSKNGYSVWQMLPINPPDQYNSPYSSTSAFAGWDKISFDESEGDIEDEGFWLNDWAYYSAIKEEYNGAPWFEWPEKLRDRDPVELRKWDKKATRFIHQQKIFQNTWNIIRTDAKNAGVELFGDIPIFIAHDSADVWAHRDLFLLDENGYPEFVSGVPPDYFSETGQKWGTVLYNWDAHEADNWRWWKERIGRAFRLFDYVRIDHFRGIHSSWAVPVGDEDARNGHWQDGPGDDLLKQIIACAPHPSKIIAEDLGIIPTEVTELRKRNNLPGMIVLQFGFDGDLEQNPNNPTNISEDQVVYVATHDNDTTNGWWKEANQEIKTNLSKLKKESETIVQLLIRLAEESQTQMIVIPLQDILELGSDSRMNIPGKSTGNWTWKFSWDDLN